MDRVNKVGFMQIFQASKGTANKENTAAKERIRTISPFLQKKLEALKSARTTRVRLFEKLKGTDTTPFTTTRRQESHHQRDLGCLRLSAALLSVLRVTFANIRRIRRPAPKLDLSQILALTQCSHCCNVGLTLLTTSTKEKFSPRFLEKVRMILPSGSLPAGQASPEPKDVSTPGDELSMVLYAEDKEPMESEKKLSMPDLSLIPMEGSLESSLASLEAAPAAPLKKQESVLSKEDWDRSTDCKTPCEGSSQSFRRPSPVPRLNISELLPAKKPCKPKAPLAPVEMLQGSPLLRKDATAAALTRFVGVFKTRLHKAFDMVFLSRANTKQQADQSLTFDFSREEESLLASGTLTGTFRQHESKLCNISAIQPVKFTEDSFVFECESKQEVSSTAKTAFRILFSRLEKAVARRKLRGFYSIAGA
jgi:hypothetical protein